MQHISIQNQPNQIVISIPKTALGKDELLALLETLQLEQLAQKVHFDDSILDLAEEINTNWWQANKQRFIGEQS